MHINLHTVVVNLSSMVNGTAIMIEEFVTYKYKAKVAHLAHMFMLEQCKVMQKFKSTKKKKNILRQKFFHLKRYFHERKKEGVHSAVNHLAFKCVPDC